MLGCEVRPRCCAFVADAPHSPHSLPQAHHILDEVVCGGMVLETQLGDIMEAIQGMNTLEGSSARASIKS